MLGFSHLRPLNDGDNAMAKYEKNKTDVTLIIFLQSKVDSNKKWKKKERKKNEHRISLVLFGSARLVKINRFSFGSVSV